MQHPNHFYLFQMFWKGVEMRDGGNAATILGELVETPLKLVQGSKAKQVNLTANKNIKKAL